MSTAGFAELSTGAGPLGADCVTVRAGPLMSCNDAVRAEVPVFACVTTTSWFDGLIYVLNHAAIVVAPGLQFELLVTVTVVAVLAAGTVKLAGAEYAQFEKSTKRFEALALVVNVNDLLVKV